MRIVDKMRILFSVIVVFMMGFFATPVMAKNAMCPPEPLRAGLEDRPYASCQPIDDDGCDENFIRVRRVVNESLIFVLFAMLVVMVIEIIFYFKDKKDKAKKKKKTRRLIILGVGIFVVILIFVIVNFVAANLLNSLC